MQPNPDATHRRPHPLRNHPPGLDQLPGRPGWAGFLRSRSTRGRPGISSSAPNLQTYIERDVRSLARVGDELAFQRFVRAAAARTGQLLNFADLARDIDIDQKTATPSRCLVTIILAGR
jgi:hypothetical protein